MMSEDTDALAASDQIAKRIGDLSPDVASGKVGFFWVVDDRAGRDVVLGETLDLGSAELYGESLTHPDGHYDFWTRMQARGPAWLRGRGLSGALLSTEYEDWPRGRVVFGLKDMRFMLLADRRLRTPERIAKIGRFFNLLEGHFDIRSDGHYAPVIPFRCLDEWPEDE